MGNRSFAELPFSKLAVVTNWLRSLLPWVSGDPSKFGGGGRRQAVSCSRTSW